MRVVATSRARPALASQAEKASINIGTVEYPEAFNWRDQRDSPINKTSIIPSRQRSAERR